MKKITLILLVAMFFTLSLPAIAANDFIVNEKRDAVYWIDNEDRFNNTFSLNRGEAANSVQRLNLTPTPLRNARRSTDGVRIYSEYSFSVGDNSEITVTGYMSNEKVTEQLSILSGILTGTATVGDTFFRVNAVVQKEYGNNMRLNAGITMAPENANGLSDYVFFAVGEPIITKDMLPSWVGAGSNSINVENEVENSRDTNNDDYAHYGGDDAFFSSNFNISGKAQTLDVYYNPTNNRACIGVKSYTSNVTNYFAAPGSVTDTIVRNLEIGMEGKSTNVPYLINVHEISSSGTGGSTIITTYYTSYIIDILGDVFNIPSAVVSLFQNLLNQLRNSQDFSVSLFNTGIKTRATFAYPTDNNAMIDVKFDNAPMCVSFNFDSSYTSYGLFKGYSNMKYYTINVPPYSNYAVYLSIDTEEAHTIYLNLRVSAA